MALTTWLTHWGFHRPLRHWQICLKETHRRPRDICARLWRAVSRFTILTLVPKSVGLSRNTSDAATRDCV